MFERFTVRTGRRENQVLATLDKDHVVHAHCLELVVTLTSTRLAGGLDFDIFFGRRFLIKELFSLSLERRVLNCARNVFLR